MLKDNNRVALIYRLLNVSALLMSLLIIFFSTHIRLGEAGLGCEPWPDCYAQVSFADEVKGLHIPDNDFSLFRSFHRSIASLLGINILVLVGLSLWQRKKISPLLPALMLFIVIFLSVLGIATPTRSIPAVTLGNIVGGMALAALCWTHMWNMKTGSSSSGLQLRYVFLALLVQVVSGAWASANYTGAACPSLLNCTQKENLLSSVPGSVNPARKLALDEQSYPQLDSASSIIQMGHRLLAVAWLMLVIFLYRKTRRTRPGLQRPMLAVVVLSVAEFTLGITNVLLDMPLWPNTLHNLLAVGLLFAFISLLIKSREANTGD